MKSRILLYVFLAAVLCGCGEKEEPYSITNPSSPTSPTVPITNPDKPKTNNPTAPTTTTAPTTPTTTTTTEPSTPTHTEPVIIPASCAYIVYKQVDVSSYVMAKKGDIYSYSYRAIIYNESNYYTYKYCVSDLFDVLLEPNCYIIIGTNINSFNLKAVQYNGKSENSIYSDPQEYNYTIKLEKDKVFICDGIPETYWLTITNNNNSTYKVTINEGKWIKSFSLKKGESESFNVDKSGYYIVCEQQNGYIFYPSVYEYDVFMDKDKTLSVKN